MDRIHPHSPARYAHLNATEKKSLNQQNFIYSL